MRGPTWGSIPRRDGSWTEQSTLPHLRPQLALAHARLQYAYADLLLRSGQPAEARHWFDSAARLDVEQQTDAQQRVDELDGFLIDFDDQPEAED